MTNNGDTKMQNLTFTAKIVFVVVTVELLGVFAVLPLMTTFAVFSTKFVGSLFGITVS
jgi:hypothetical protein